MTLIETVARDLRAEAMGAHIDGWDTIPEHSRNYWRRLARASMTAFISYRPFAPNTPDDELRALIEPALADMRNFGVAVFKDGVHVPAGDIYLPGEHPGELNNQPWERPLG